MWCGVGGGKGLGMKAGVEQVGVAQVGVGVHVCLSISTCLQLFELISG